MATDPSLPPAPIQSPMLQPSGSLSMPWIVWFRQVWVRIGGSIGTIGSGTVTSVAFKGDGVVLDSTPSSPVTISGNVQASLKTQVKNTVLAGPSSGANAAPTFRALVLADLPSIDTNPVGTVLTFAGSSAPTGYVAADGSSLARAGTYAALFAVIGTTYGGSGSNFNLPDYRGLFLRGVGTNATALQSNGGAVAGAALGTLQSDQMQGHLHPLPTSTSALSGTSYASGGGSLIQSQVSGSPGSDGTNGTPRTGAETRPANLSVLYCIKF